MSHTKNPDFYVPHDAPHAYMLQIAFVHNPHGWKMTNYYSHFDSGGQTQWMYHIHSPKGRTIKKHFFFFPQA